MPDIWESQGDLLTWTMKAVDACTREIAMCKSTVQLFVSY
jgi:hypothetical protein